MQHKILQLREYAWQFIQRFQDVKFAGLMLFVLIVLLISWSGVKSIQTNYELQKQIATARQQTQVQSLANNNLKLENEYYTTGTYLDLSARQNFGLAAPGEKEIIVPKDIALSYTVELPKATKVVDKPSDKQPTLQRNFQEWVNFFLHRNQAAA